MAGGQNLITHERWGLRSCAGNSNRQMNIYIVLLHCENFRWLNGAKFSEILKYWRGRSDVWGQHLALWLADQRAGMWSTCRENGNPLSLDILDILDILSILDILVQDATQLLLSSFIFDSAPFQDGSQQTPPRLFHPISTICQYLPNLRFQQL